MKNLIEKLEGRWLLSGTSPHTGNGSAFDPGQYGPAVIVQNGTALAVSNAHDVQIEELVNNQITVIDKSSVPAVTTVYDGITDLTITGTKWGDIISAGVFAVNTTVNTNGGADEVIFSNNGTGNDVINAQFGNDTIGASNNDGGTLVLDANGHSSLTVVGNVTVI